MFIRNLIFVLLVLSLMACSQRDSKENLEINSLKKALALGAMKDLNVENAHAKGQQHELLLRLYEVPLFENDCFVETHGICQYEYFIAVSSYDEYPETNVYKIPVQGQLISHSWLKDDSLDQEKIQFTFGKYTPAALKNNSTLVDKKTQILIQLSPKKLEVIKNGGK